MLRKYLNNMMQKCPLSRVLIITALFIVGLAAESFAQNYEFTLNQRRMGDTIGVEVWARSISSSAANLGNMSIALKYNSTFLTPAALDLSKADYGNPAATTDSVSSDVTTDPFTVLKSNFASSTYGYGGLTGRAADAVVGTDRIYVFELDVNLSSGGTGFAPLQPEEVLL